MVVMAGTDCFDVSFNLIFEFSRQKSCVLFVLFLASETTYKYVQT